MNLFTLLFYLCILKSIGLFKQCGIKSCLHATWESLSVYILSLQPSRQGVVADTVVNLNYYLYLLNPIKYKSTDNIMLW